MTRALNATAFARGYNQLSTWNGQGITFDADGNMTHGPLPSGTLSNYDYDSRNRLTSANGSNYRYSPDGLRVEITTSAGASAAGTGATTFVIFSVFHSGEPQTPKPDAFRWSVLPAWLRDPFYKLIARTRYALFGEYRPTPLPKPKWEKRFLAR